MSTQYYESHLICMIFGRTDLRTSVSGANFDAESDFEVGLAVAPQKPGQNCGTTDFPIQKIRRFFCFAVKT